MNQMFEVVVSEKATGEVVETRVMVFAEAEAIFKGYENDKFYAVKAKYIR